MKRDTRNIRWFELRKDLVRGLEVEDFAGTVVEGVLDGSELLATDLAEIHAFGQELADQAIGVLIGAPLPRTVRVTEEHLDLEVLASVLCSAISRP